MVVAMIAMRMVEVALNEIIHVIAMGNGGMAAIGTVNVPGRMLGGGKAGRAFVGIDRTDGDLVFVHMVAMRVMEMAVVKIIYVPFMLDRRVSTTLAVGMGMIRMRCARM